MDSRSKTLLASSCPRCHVNVAEVIPVTPGEEPQAGDGYVCPCGALCVFTEDGVREMTEAEKTLLTEDEKSDIDFAARNIAAVQRSNNH